MRLFLVCFILFLLPAVSHAALAPYDQSVREIKDLLRLPAVNSLMPSRSPLSAIKKEGNTYKLYAGDCVLIAKVRYIYDQDGRVGPSRYLFEVADKIVCADED